MEITSFEKSQKTAKIACCVQAANHKSYPVTDTLKAVRCVRYVIISTAIDIKEEG